MDNKVTGMLEGKERLLNAAQAHTLDDRWLGARLIGILEADAKGNGWWAAVLRANGEIQYRYAVPPGKDPVEVLPDPDKREFARQLVMALNREVHYEGAWIVAWYDGSRRWSMFWKDWDGDLNCIVDNDEPWVRVRQAKLAKWVEDAHAAVRKVLQIKYDVLGLKPDQEVKLAQGQPLSDATKRH